MARKYNPKNRTPEWVTKGRLLSDRVAWVSVDWMDVVQLRFHTRDEIVRNQEGSEAPEPDEDEVEWGTEVRIGFLGTRQRMWLPLTRWTLQELEAAKTLIDRAFAEARTECERRDALAQEAYANGNDSFQRLYRPVPQIIYRKGEEPQHGPSVRGGSEGPPELERPAGSD